MRLSWYLALVAWSANNRVGAFVPTSHSPAFFSSTRVVQNPSTRIGSTDTSSPSETTTETENKTKKLGLITFDLDDTLYPVAPVLADANRAFAKAMERFGYEGIEPDDIDETGKKIRDEMSKSDPDAAAILTHTEIRMLSIRQVLEKVLLDRMLIQTAEDWATDVLSLTKPVVESAKKWARNAVPPAVVQAVYNAWEMERYHAAERYLYPEVIEVFLKIKEDHPDAIIGAVTDGKANPLLMTFTIAPYFDFCMSWEDDQGARSKFFKELGSVEGNAELTWIYDAALDKYKEIFDSTEEMNVAAGHAPKDAEERIWIHVGDDLGYDVGGSAACGAKTVLADYFDEYEQTAKKRYDPDFLMPAWSNSPEVELQKRQDLNEKARARVTAKIDRISELPVAISEILDAQE
eukprot:CAMPEP_0198291256 /NCGR_PEP_ID=MMETSP1449-20131203/8846_1 /TAXON_ID=420275 /ORGANISM="Attheya septentrionalis, Strain CCMP2084" /LENGTH=405 /DNA_ID=CAMNT_0043989873 /DNA_START=109 /DNA_END=1326 /DNA_ORIENTATION=+